MASYAMGQITNISLRKRAMRIKTIFTAPGRRVWTISTRNGSIDTWLEALFEYKNMADSLLRTQDFIISCFIIALSTLALLLFMICGMGSTDEHEFRIYSDSQMRCIVIFN